ncbi:hypothetical protein TB2_011841 [Malus domestica]
MTSIPRLLHDHSFFDTMDTGPEDKGGGSKFHKMQLKMAVVQIKLLRNKKQAVVKQMRGDIALPLQSGHDIREKYGKDFVYTAIDVHPGCGANRMLWCEMGHMQFVDSASAAEVAANSASDTMAAAQVAAYLANKDSNQKIKVAFLLSLIVSLRSICEGRFQSLDQFLSREYCISLADNIESKVKLREGPY